MREESKRGTHDASINEGIFEVGVTGEKLGVQEGRVGDGVEEGDVDCVTGGEVVDGDGGKGHWGGEGEVARRRRGKGVRVIRVGCLEL